MKAVLTTTMVLVLMLGGCTQQADQSAPQEAEKAAAEKAAVGSKEEAMTEEAAKTEEAPEVARCLDLVSQAKFEDALPVCLDALENHPANERVQEAVKSAQAAVGDLAAKGEEAAKDAKEAAEETARDAMEY